MKISKRLITMILIVAIVSFSTGVLADDLRENIQATRCKDIYLTYNGDEFLARDANEDIVYPLVVNGSTYLPVRAVASIAGLKVEWVGDTRTVALTSSDYVPVDETGYSIETEINDTKKDANILAVNDGKFKGRVGETLSSGTDKNDYYKFVVEEQGIVDIKITTDSEAELNVSVLDENGDYIQGIYSVPADGIVNFKLPLEPGTYYLYLDYNYSESAYKINTSFKATPDDYENDYYESDTPPVEFSGDNMTFTGAVGTRVDRYKDHIIIKDFNSSTYEFTVDWIGDSFDDFYIRLYDEDGHKIGDDIEFDKLKNHEVISGVAESEISYMVVTIVPSNSTPICNEYTLKVSK